MEQTLSFKPLNDCSIKEMTDLWNAGFEHYVSNMSRTPFQMSVRLGKFYIHPDLSVAAYIGGAPVGFVMIGWREIGGKKLAWNGGTGVASAFRGRGLSKLLLAEAVRRVRAAGADRLSLEVRTDNDRAIAAYRSQGFVAVDRVVNWSCKDFERTPFLHKLEDKITLLYDVPSRVAQLPFYNSERCSWTTEWFNLESAQSLMAIDRFGKVVAYALFQEDHSSPNEAANTIRLFHCEADPDQPNRSGLIRALLAELWKPCTLGIGRRVKYARASNSELTEALVEAGFAQTLEEYLMHLELSGTRMEEGSHAYSE